MGIKVTLLHSLGKYKSKMQKEKLKPKIQKKI